MAETEEPERLGPDSVVLRGIEPRAHPNAFCSKPDAKKPFYVFIDNYLCYYLPANTRRMGVEAFSADTVAIAGAS
jgi:hypothetical protein